MCDASSNRRRRARVATKNGVAGRNKKQKKKRKYETPPAALTRIRMQFCFWRMQNRVARENYYFVVNTCARTYELRNSYIRSSDSPKTTVDLSVITCFFFFLNSKKIIRRNYRRSNYRNRHVTRENNVVRGVVSREPETSHRRTFSIINNKCVAVHFYSIGIDALPRNRAGINAGSAYKNNKTDDFRRRDVFSVPKIYARRITTFPTKISVRRSKNVTKKPECQVFHANEKPRRVRHKVGIKCGSCTIMRAVATIFRETKRLR